MGLDAADHDGRQWLVARNAKGPRLLGVGTSAKPGRKSDASIDSLSGQVVRIEFFLKAADLYSFRASVPTP